MENVLKAIDLSKEYKGKKCLDNVSISIDKGDIYGLIGKNGAGKTTFMKACLNIVLPTHGRCFIFGRDGKQTRKKVGALIENPVFFKDISAYKNMEYFSILYNGNKNAIDSLLTYVGLSEYKHKKVKDFSLGMKQRLGIAIAMIGEPELIILDEPINGLDPAGIKEVRDLILKLNKEKKITFLISSHLLDELSKIATKYGIIDCGVLIEEISREELAEKCGRKIVVEVDDTKKSLEILETMISKDCISIEDNKISVYSDVDLAGEINNKLVKNDILVTMLYKQVQSLEQYFMEKVGQ